MQTREPELSPPATPPDGVELPDSGATNGDATRKGPRKRVIGIVVGGIALVLMLIFGIRYLAYAHAHEGTDDARVDFTWSSTGRAVSATGPAIWRGGYNSGKINSTNNLYLNTEITAYKLCHNYLPFVISNKLLFICFKISAPFSIENLTENEYRFFC